MRIALFPALLLVLALAGCDSATPPLTSDLEAGPILEHVALDVITATYADLDAEAADLVTATATLQSNPTEATLLAAQAQWRATRAPWEMSEGFLFGPVDTEGLDPSLDSWPVNVADLNAVLASQATLTPAYVRGLEDNLRGFHTIEYLLFGEESSRTVADLDARELAYLTATAAVLAQDADRLHAAWDPGADNYAGVLMGAGDNTVFVSQRAALQELLTGIAGIADEVGSGKMGAPFGDQNTLEVESRFSGNSLADFENNIRSILHLYTGTYAGATGPGLSAFVAERDAALDARVRTEIEAAIDAIRAIPGPFRTAIFDHPVEVQAAIDAVLVVRSTFQNDVAALLG